jgi:RND superfamily putative drug exporter
MQKLVKNHIGALVGWLLAIIIAIVAMPDTAQLIRDYGQTKIPDSAQSQVATTIQKDWGRGLNNVRQVVVVFNNGDSALTGTQKKAIKKTVKRLRRNENKYKIKQIMAPNDNAETKKQLISKDKTTQLVQLQVSKSKTARQTATDVEKLAKTSGVKTYVTGGDILTDDFSQSTQEGIKKTEVIAAVFIFIVLILVFRSPVVPLISLATVGVSVLTSLSIVMNLVKYFGFPLSDFTQVFMVVVLFGIGTDYNILLYDQFKAELSAGLEPHEATRKARKIAGKTILYSGSSLLIGFSALGLAKFSIYRSALGVAVGVAVLLLVLLTLNPFFMSVLGRKMFWPVQKFEGGSSSKLWHRLSSSSVLHPLISLGIVLICTLPFSFTYNSNLNYDTTAELSDTLPAKVGFRVVQKHFSKGTAEPATLYIQSDKPLNKEKYLDVIDRVTKKLQKEDGVKTVASVTQPGGTKIKALYVKDQLGTVTNGMDAAGAGLAKINKGLKEATSKLAGSNMQSGLDGVQTMIAGTNKLKTGSEQISAGTKQLSAGATTLANGSSVLENGIGSLNTGLQTLSGKSGQVNSGVNQLSTQSSQLPLAIAGLTAYNQQISAGLTQVNSSLASNQSTLNGLSSQMSSATSMINKAKTLKSELATAKTMLKQADQMVALLDQVASSKDKLSGLSDDVASLTDLKKTLTSDLTMVGAGSVMAKVNDSTVARDAQKIIDDPNATDASKATAKQILSAVNSNLKATTGNYAKIDAALKDVQTQAGKLTIPDTSALTKLAAYLPSSSDVAKLKTELASTESMIDEADSMLTEVNSLSSTLNKVKTLPDQMNQLTSAINQLHAGATKASAIATQLNSGVNGSGVNLTSAQTIQSTIGNSTLTNSLNQLASGITAYTNGVDTAANGSSQLNSGAGQITSGAQQLATGAGTLAAKTPALTSGLNTELAGQKTMYSTLKDLVGQMKTLQSGLKSASNGVGTINTGVKSANSYLTGLKQSSVANNYYVPKSVLKGKTYKQAVKQYMSSDHKTTSMTIVLKADPSSAEAMSQVDKMQKVVKNELKGTSLSGAKVAIGGQTASTSDTQKIASGDFTRTAAIMIIGILLALMVVTRSILQPFYIMGTLLLAYITSLSLTRFVSGMILGQNELTWNTPFFTFVMLIALGVDYSIFLMMKYREFGQNGGDPRERIVSASAIIGAVVISAAIILSGTFAALMPSGVLTLIQVAMGVIIGLVILVIILPVIMSALIRLTYGGKNEDDK